MDEAMWNECCEPQKMLEFLHKSKLLTPRKTRLWACACARFVWHLLPEEGSRGAIEVAERYADQRATQQELREADERAWDVDWTVESAAAWACCEPDHWITANCLADSPSALTQCAVLRELFGPLPFRPLTLDMASLTSVVRALADAAYDNREVPRGRLDPQRLGVLADAAEEAGVPPEVVAHLRSAGPHWRGCWALDLLLGKS